MTKTINQKIADNLGIAEDKVKIISSLFEEGNTIPFIARYRKELTGGVNEILLRKIQDQIKYFKTLRDRKNEVLDSINKQGKLTDKLKSDIEKAETLQQVEDIYLPFKKKKKTKADLAIELGLQPAADFLKKAKHKNSDFFKKFINKENNLQNEQDVIKFSSYIIAEEISSTPAIREFLRSFLSQKGILTSSLKDQSKDVKSVYKDYYEFEQNVKYIPSYRVLAIFRGIKEEILKGSIKSPYEPLEKISRIFGIRDYLAYNQTLVNIVADSYKRLLFPSLEREIMASLKEKAEDRAIEVFSKNLKHLLLTPPLKQKVVLGIDPAYRTGCKMAIVDKNGTFLEAKTIFPTPPHNKISQSITVLNDLLDKYTFTLVAIGNGTACRETEEFIMNWINEYNLDIEYIIISESGASVYSASEIAIEEFPDIDLTSRSAISLARRAISLLDEMVKIPPESIGVGMYQHDVNRKKLQTILKREVESVVNFIGVDLNRASPYLLQYVSGFSRKLAENVCNYRNDNGNFYSRNDLLKVKGLGKKAFEQAAGFCRIPQSLNPLDNTIIHPESYSKVYRIFEYIEHKIDSLKLDKEKLIFDLNQLNFDKIPESYKISKADFELITEAIVNRLVDPRDEYPQPLLKKEVKSINDMHNGMILQGTIKNITDFGAFVDIGTKTNGLIHKSQIPNRVSPIEYFYIGQIVEVKIEQIDINRSRIQLAILKTG